MAIPLVLAALAAGCSRDRPVVSSARTRAPDGGAGAFSVIADPEDEAAYVYDQNELRTYELRIAEADLALLDADPAAEQYVPGMLIFEGREYGPVGVRYKGSAGAFLGCVENSFSGGRPSGAKTCAKLSMKVSLNWQNPDGAFYGLRKLQFHAMRADPSMMKERFVYWLFRQVGVPAPRAVHARLLINGQLEGLFSLVEQIDGRFTRARFTDGGEGNLYKEVWPTFDDEQIYRNALETNEDENPSVRTMVSFAKALAEASEEALPGVVDTYLDRDAILDYLAVDRTIQHFDGPLSFYCGPAVAQGNNPGPYGNHNYYWYEGVRSERLALIPWDVDLDLFGFEFGTGAAAHWYTKDGLVCECPPRSDGGGIGISRPTLIPAACDRLILGLSALRAEYGDHVREVLSGPFQESAVDPHLDAWSEQIATAVEEQAAAPEIGGPTVDAWRSAGERLRTTLDSRRTAMAEEIAD